jgi:hypothetical protein
MAAEPATLDIPLTCAAASKEIYLLPHLKHLHSYQTLWTSKFYIHPGFLKTCVFGTPIPSYRNWLLYKAQSLLNNFMIKCLSSWNIFKSVSSLFCNQNFQSYNLSKYYVNLYSLVSINHRPLKLFKGNII